MTATRVPEFRYGELLAFRWSDVDLDKRAVAITRDFIRRRAEGLGFTDRKRRPLSRRAGPVREVARGKLRAHKACQNEERLLVGPAYKGAGLVLGVPDGGPVDPRYASRTLDRLRGKVGPTH